jgi:metallo-beta-lactamase family protein
MATLQFAGAAGNVTGSQHILEVGGLRLMVDCGLYQEREFAHRNWSPFLVPPASIDAVLLTHAHLDHSGLLPKLVREGFTGRIYCTPATAEITEILLLDSGHIQEEDAAFKKRRHQREGRRGPYPETPLYTARDARRVTPHFEPVPYHRPFQLAPDVTVEFRDAGHVLGSAMIEVRFPNAAGEERGIVFSGDLGRPNTVLLRDPEPLPPTDYVVVESTYGDRVHGEITGIQDTLARIVAETAEAGGNLVIPSFALERAQELLYHFKQLRDAHAIPALRVFVDSPMATSITKVFRHHLQDLDRPAQREFEGRHSPFEFPGLTFVRTAEESKSLNAIRGTAVIIAGAGMCNGGRIKHHLVANIERPESTILFVGYQAAGTLGRHILDGDDPVRILGQQHAARARIVEMDAFSAHADRDDLEHWLMATQPRPKRAFIVHGEEHASHSLAALMRDRGLDAVVAEYDERIDLD